jgi:hypothetical protein
MHYHYRGRLSRRPSPLRKKSHTKTGGWQGPSPSRPVAQGTREASPAPAGSFLSASVYPRTCGRDPRSWAANNPTRTCNGVAVEVPYVDARCPNWIPLDERNRFLVPVLTRGGPRPDGHIMITANRAISLSPRPYAIGCWGGMSRKSQREASRSPRQLASYAE